MCGIIGIYSKSEVCSEELGARAADMLLQMADRGPDSAGLAIYRNRVGEGEAKVSLRAAGSDLDWRQLEAELDDGLGLEAFEPFGDAHALVTVRTEPARAASWIDARLPAVEVVSAGHSIEIFKDAVTPAEFLGEFGIDAMSGSHALGHTRMATESRVTPAGSHPFWTGYDLCLVHNGSLSNHNRLRAELEREQGIIFRTENDSEVAAAYLTSRMAAGESLETALEGCLEDLNGFYTFAVGTADGFAVLRDPIACKPAVMAETDDWVAMASEYRALATLPGGADAALWEPEPGVVYSWGRVAV